MAEHDPSGFSLTRYLARHPAVRERLNRIKEISARVRTNSYQLTNECNLRCRGCWYYAYDMDKDAGDERDLERIRTIFRRHVEQGVTHGLIIGGEPLLFPKRLAVIAEILPFMSVATNGYRKLQVAGFENVSIGLSLFAGLRSDDSYRGITASGRTIEGLFRRALGHYRDDKRVTVVYALTEAAVDEIEPTVKLIEDSGIKVYFSYYRHYRDDSPAAAARATAALRDTALAVQERFPKTVLAHPYYIQALISGATDWGRFGYASCATISTGHKDNAGRLTNGAPVLPNFQSFAQDLVTNRFCCASGDCANCRDSLAVSSWLLVNFREHARSEVRLRNWIEFAESYWSGFVWSPLHWSKTGGWRPIEAAVAAPAARGGAGAAA
jgi:hypothetical protein